MSLACDEFQRHQSRSYSCSQQCFCIGILRVIILVLALKLYKKLVYRLALYQVLSSLLLATVTALQVQVIFHSIIMSIRSSVHRCGVVKCVRIMDEAALHNVGGLCFGILHKNLTKFEVLYLVTSMLVPAVTSPVPTITD